MEILELRVYIPMSYLMLKYKLEPVIFAEYTPFIIPSNVLDLKVTFLGDERPISVSHPKKTQEFQGQKSYDSTDKVDLSTFGPTTLAPLGLITHARYLLLKTFLIKLVPETKEVMRTLAFGCVTMTNGPGYEVS